MVKYDLLFNYADIKTIEIVLEKFSRRIKSKVPLEKGVQVYLNNIEEISSKFDLFFSEMMVKSDIFIREL